ncbi:hypothetical protein SAMN05216516_11357 [Izhakiella capsodis]|uniref:Uncharacterized protein n=1 Tax=Izhakiella capsodis TaxID=1367852 RepID=A0A1I5AXB0_9GAMM|nr:hypothetical protein [Izhakiella capsodis]SFN66869.1 hypothetical protein SAMN05216516_11357 [Izhakiella capsodis]
MADIRAVTRNYIDNKINDNKNSSKNECTNRLAKSIGLDDLPEINLHSNSCAPLIFKPESEKVDINNLKIKLANSSGLANKTDCPTEYSDLYILLLINKVATNSAVSDIINNREASNAEYISMSRDTNSGTPADNIISKVLHYLKEMAPVLKDIIPLLSLGLGAPGSILLLADAIDKIQQMITGVSLEDKLECDVIKPLLNDMTKYISEAMVDLGVSQPTAQVVSENLAKIICAAISIATLQLSGNLIDDQVYEEVYEVIKQNFMPDSEILGSISDDVFKEINTLLPASVSNQLQPFEQDVEAAFSQFSGNVINMVFSFASQQGMGTDAIEKLLAAVKNSLRSQLGDLLHQLFTTAKDDVLQLDKKYMTELLSNLGKEISDLLKDVLPTKLWIQLQPFEECFAEFSTDFVGVMTGFSGDLMNIIADSVQAGHLDTHAMRNALTAMEEDVQSSLDRLMNAVVATAGDVAKAAEQKYLAELLSCAGNKITALLQKELPQALQPLLRQMENNFSAFDSDVIGVLTGFSGNLINIIANSVRAGHLDTHALGNAFIELQEDVQGSLDRLMNAVVATAGDDAKAAEQKYLAELLSCAGNKITALLQEELPQALQPLLRQVEDDFSAFDSDFVGVLTGFSGDLMNIIANSVRAGHLDTHALSNAFIELQEDVQGSLDRLMNAVVATAGDDAKAAEQKYLAELLSCAGNKITALLQKELPQALQPLLRQMENNFSAFDSDVIGELTGFSDNLVNIIADSVRAGHLDTHALSNAFFELQEDLQGSLERLMNAVVATTGHEALASEQKYIAELLSYAGNKITAVLQEELPQALQPILKQVEDNFSVFDSDFVGVLTGFSGQLMNIIASAVCTGHLDTHTLSNAFTALKANVQGAVNKLLESIKADLAPYGIDVYSTPSEGPADESSYVENITSEINQSISEVSKIIHDSVLKNVLSSLQEEKPGKIRTAFGLMA